MLQIEGLVPSSKSRASICWDQTLTFRLETVWFASSNKTVFRARSRLIGQVLLELPTKEIIQVATVDYSAGASSRQPGGGLSGTQRHVDRAACERSITPIPLSGKAPLALKAPASNETYARVSGDYNPIHVSRVFCQLRQSPRHHYARHVLECCGA